MEKVISATALLYLLGLHKMVHYKTTDSIPWTDSPKPVLSCNETPACFLPFIITYISDKSWHKNAAVMCVQLQ